MVSDNRPQAQFRLCPDLGMSDRDGAPLMQHHITMDTCERRQDRGYHKCCRCVHQELTRNVNVIDRNDVARLLRS